MKRALQILIFSISAAACYNSTGPEHETATNNNANSCIHKYATRIEVPALCNEDIFLTHTTEYKGKESITYSISHNPQRRHCRWTAFTFNASNNTKNWFRDYWKNTEWKGDPFQHTPELSQNAEMSSKEIWNSGGSEHFNRGHIVASEDRVYSKEANEQTFYLSNISPMYSRFNTGAWLDCEGLVQGWGRNDKFCDTLYVVKGATIREGEYRTVDICPTVPNYYFMAILCLKNNTYKAIGLLFKHLNGESMTEACSIDYLENFTGIDFFCNISDRIEEIVEQRCTPGQWNGLNNYTLIE